jgi:hypothetical protein
MRLLRACFTASPSGPGNRLSRREYDTDLKALIGQVTRTAGADPIAIIAAPEQAASIKLQAAAGFSYPVMEAAR